MSKLKEILWNAQVLADFANLEPAQADHFREKHPDFVPFAWWDHRNGEQWRMTQGFLQEAWKNHFTGGTYFVARLILSVFDPAQTGPAIMDEMFPGTKREGPKVRYIEIEDAPWGTTPFQMAVLHLFEHPWRARFCKECRKRFVAAEPKNKFCSFACSDKNRLRQKRKWWNKDGKAWRKRQRRKVAGR